MVCACEFAFALLWVSSSNWLVITNYSITIMLKNSPCNQGQILCKELAEKSPEEKRLLQRQRKGKNMKVNLQERKMACALEIDFPLLWVKTDFSRHRGLPGR